MQKGANTFIAQHAYKKLAAKGLHGFSFLCYLFYCTQRIAVRFWTALYKQSFLYYYLLFHPVVKVGWLSFQPPSKSPGLACLFPPSKPASPPLNKEKQGYCHPKLAATVVLDYLGCGQILQKITSYLPFLITFPWHRREMLWGQGKV